MARQHPKPTRPQLRYLRRLAERSGTTFSPPRTFAEAAREIDQLKQRSRSARFERQADRHAVSRGLAKEQPASSVRDDEIQGYGARAGWR
jgi:hypothetical protein